MLVGFVFKGSKVLFRRAELVRPVVFKLEQGSGDASLKMCPILRLTPTLGASLLSCLVFLV
jgi:hypothetical protein